MYNYYIVNTIYIAV